MGWFCPSTDIDEEGKPRITEAGLGCLLSLNHFGASSHAWLEQQGITSSTRDRLKPEHYVRLTRSPESYGHLAKANSLTKLETIDLTKGWNDRDGVLDSLCGVGKQRAALARRDGTIARRGQNEDKDLRAPSQFVHNIE